MPGTPFIFVAAALWRLFYTFEMMKSTAAQGFTDFTFQHINWLFIMTRGMTLFFYGVSIVLFYRVARRVVTHTGACLGTLLLMMAPVYASYSTFVRVESMAMCLVLGAILVTYYAIEQRPEVLECPDGPEI